MKILVPYKGEGEGGEFLGQLRSYYIARRTLLVGVSYVF